MSFDKMLNKFEINCDDLLNRKSLYIKIPNHEKIKSCPINYIESYKLKDPNFHINLHKIITKYKTFIDNKDISYRWNKLKLFTNLFELISYNNISRDITSLIDYVPLSRAYFKFQELLTEYKLIDNSHQTIRYAGLAEGPGGFVECFINHRRSCFQDTYDNIYCITLKSGTTGSTGSTGTVGTIHSNKSTTPEWNKIQHLISSRKKMKAKVILSYGKDNTGNLYHLQNILHFRDLIISQGGKVDLVTGDGGLDYSTNFNFQEQMSFQLIFCEIVSAFSILKNGGNFVLKIFDIYTTVTLQFLFLLSNYFETVIISKPYTSRPANSEKYVVCKNFNGLSDVCMNKLYETVTKWNHTTLNGKYIDNILGMKIPPYFKKNIMNYCNYISSIQIENILRTVLCRNFNKQQIDSLLRSQISHTIYWAIKYNQPINYKSIFFKSFKS